jgi:pimeloyl-ACP methyl ester carboxylesterase
MFLSHPHTLLAVVLICAFASAGASDSHLDRSAAEQKIQQLWKERVAELQTERAAEMESKTIVLADKKLRWAERVYGDAPAHGHSLWISMHGGGNAPAGVNDHQWTNQISLYKLEEGIYIAPRAPTDNWNLWHESHIDPMFDRLIEDYIALRGVDPDRVYIMGYSAGGDGVWQLAPRMADRFAAAAMMAGHPNDASLLGLRNLPIALFVGGEDSAYDRNKVVAERGKELDDLHAADPKGYIHMLRVYPGLPHWMQHKDAEAIPWMAKFTRNPWPRKIVWRQSTVTHTRFYWLEIPKEAAQPNQQITAEIQDQTIRLTGDVPNNLRLRLSDELLDLDKSIRVFVNDREVLNQLKCPRSSEAIRESLVQRADPRSAATATLTLSLHGNGQ